MKFVLAPDSFKESMTAKEVCSAMESGIRRVYKDAECIHVPMADGGEGTVQSLVDATEGTIYKQEVTAPLGNKVLATYGILGDGETAIIEIAEASGLQLVPREKRNPLITTSYGTGELIISALNKGVKKILIGLGGSATNDAGIGMLQALGIRFIDEDGQDVGFGGGELSKIVDIDMSSFDNRILNVDIEVACDVKNPLTGINGASYVFGPQKGADKEIVKILDDGLKHFSNIIKERMDKEIDNIEGAGAAGGLGAALLGLCNGKLRRGIDIVIEYSKLEEKIKGADYVFTGEGSIDFQSKFGKTPVGVSMIAKKHGIPVIVFSGNVGEGIDELYDFGITSVIGILPGVTTIEEALKQGPINIERAVKNIVRIL